MKIFHVRLHWFDSSERRMTNITYFTYFSPLSIVLVSIHFQDNTGTRVDKIMRMILLMMTLVIMMMTTVIMIMMTSEIKTRIIRKTSIVIMKIIMKMTLILSGMIS